MKKHTKTHKHLSYDDRLEIQKCLDCGMTFKAIGRRIGKHETSVSREVKKHARIQRTAVVKKTANGTIENSICKQLLKSPFVCNPCKRRRCACAYDKHIYCAKTAHKEYEKELVEAREHVTLNKEQFWNNNQIICDGLNKGQHLYQIIHANDLSVSETTVYRHAKKGYLSTDLIAFPRMVKFKARPHAPRNTIPKGLKMGRTYADFLLFMQENELSGHVEMDTLVGRIGGKAILTLHFTASHFMLGFLLNNLSAPETKRIIQGIKRTLFENGLSFSQFFSVLLTDRGTEFSDVFSIENDLRGTKEISLFFCDPCQSSQKPHVEKNHSLFRDIVPKGSSFDDFTQVAVNLIFSHINSTARRVLAGKTPYEMFCFIHNDAFPSLFGIEQIHPLDIVQSPELLKS